MAAAEPDQTPFKVSLRNEHAPTYATSGFLELSVRTRPDSLAASARSTGPLSARTAYYQMDAQDGDGQAPQASASHST